MAVVEIQRQEEFRTVTRTHITAWREDLRPISEQEQLLLIPCSLSLATFEKVTLTLDIRLANRLFLPCFSVLMALISVCASSGAWG